MNMMLSFLTVLLVVGSQNQTVSGTAQQDAKLAAILERISKTSPEGNQVIEKIEGLKPEVNERVSTKTLGEMVDEYAKNKGAYNITPIGWEASQKKPLVSEKNARWRIVFDYQDWEKQLRAAEWEYNADTNKLYPFERHNAPQFWNAAPQKIDPGVSAITDSVQRSLAAFRGKIVILNFWATWCAACGFETPVFEELQRQYHDLGVEVVGVSLDPLVPRGEPSGAAAVAAFMRSHRINYHILMVDNQSALAGFDLERGVPATYVLDREGRIAKTHFSATPTPVFEQPVAQSHIESTPMSEFEEDIRQLLSQHSKTECEPLVSTQAIDPAGQEFDVGQKMLNCVRQEGVKRVGAHPLSPTGDRYIFVGEFWQGWATSGPGLTAQKYDLWMVNVSGTGLQRLTTNGTSSDPEWSPDGNKIVFADKGSIKVLDGRSKEIRTLIEASVSSEPDQDSDWVVYGQPKWSPSGKAIAVVAREQHSDKRKSITRVVLVTTDGWRLCQFARGVEHHQWNKEGELMLDYGKFIFDWDGFTFGKRPKPDSDETNV